ncbi:MAG TPA: VWA domain-containing protein [Pyrinomonadaceae bacterium]
MRAQRLRGFLRAAFVPCLVVTSAFVIAAPAHVAAQPQAPTEQKTEQQNAQQPPAAPKAADTAAPKPTDTTPSPAAAGASSASTTNTAPPNNNTTTAPATTGAANAGEANNATAPGAAAPLGPGVPVDDSKTIISHTDLVTVTVTVTDMYGRFVTGLGKNAFSVFEEKAAQDILFFSDEDAPVSLGVVFDVSGSMSGDKIMKAREALSRFIDTSHKNDEYFLIGFNHRPQLLLNRTRDSDALLDKLTFVQTKGQTALYDATYLGVERVTRGSHKKRAILLISDGQDNSSRYTYTEVKRMLKESDVIIYAVGIIGGGGSGELDMSGRAILEELAGVSGGKAFFPSTSAEMNDTFERIALELRTQYSISYRPSNFTNDGKWRKIKVKVQPPRGFPRLFVRGREGYFAVTNPK